MAPSPIVSTEQVAAVVDAYLDRMADLARRLDVPAAAVGEVTRRAGVATVDALAREPELVSDILGRWASNIRALATRVRTGTTTSVPTTASAKRADTGDAGAVAGGREARATAAVLAGLDERARSALLMRDSYDAPPGAVAVALGVTPTESAIIVAEARLRLLEGIKGQPAPTLEGHEIIAGISVGTLGAMADGSAADADPQVRLRRRHVGGCQACAAILDAQNRARVVMSGLPVLGLPDATRQTTLDAILGRATTTLLTADEVEVALSRDARVLPGAVVGLALAFALILGAGIGAILRHSKTSADQSPSAVPSGVILSSPTASAGPTSTASPTASATSTSTSTPSFLQSYSPVAVPSSLRPSVSKSKAKTSAGPKASKSAGSSRAPATTAPPTSAATDVPTSQAPETSAPATSDPATSAPPSSAPPTSSPPILFPTPTG